MDGDDLIGLVISDGQRVGRIVVASRLLDFALIEDLGPDGEPTGRKSVLKTLKNIGKANVQ